MTKLMTSLEISNSRKQDDVQFEMEREARDNEILEQESAYEQSLKADRDRIKKLQEEEEKKRKEEQQKLKEEAENAQKQQEAENSLPPEPPAGNNVSFLTSSLTPTLSGFEILNKTILIIQNKLAFKNKRIFALSLFEFCYHKDLENQGNLRECFVLLTVTQW